VRHPALPALHCRNGSAVNQSVGAAAITDRQAVRPVRVRPQFAHPRGYRQFEVLVVLGILERLDNGLCGQAVPHGVAARPLLPGIGQRSGAVSGIAPIGFDLP
jgi:hypothetical protein